MLFTSPLFIYLFFPISGLVSQFLESKLKVYFLIIMSFLFYMTWRADHFFLLILSANLDFFVGGYLAKKDSKSRKPILFLSVFINLLVLAVFKYSFFILGLFDFMPADFKLILPLGISFYTFQSMSYSIDMYYRKYPPCDSLSTFFLYITFFPQLIAGPLVRFNMFRQSIVNLKPMPVEGFISMNLGLAKKVLIADQIGELADYIFLYDGHDPSTALVGTLCIGIQIYFDFSGYTDIAIGLGLILGIELPQNFNSPYRAKSMRDFWRRWHITLSQWFRDYLYIPLGGNKGSKLNVAFRVGLVMILCGFWHGADVTFIIWGASMAFFYLLEKLLFPTKIKNSSWYRYFTIAVVFILWIPFRSSNLEQMLSYFKNFISISKLNEFLFLEIIQPHQVLALIASFYIIIFLKPTMYWMRNKSTYYFVSFVALFFFVLLENFSNGYKPFIYFEF